MQDVAPSAVRTAEAIDTIICTINLAVSFFVIITQIFNVFRILMFRSSYARFYKALATKRMSIHVGITVVITAVVAAARVAAVLTA
jgi:hypothetical protein